MEIKMNELKRSEQAMNDARQHVMDANEKTRQRTDEKRHHKHHNKEYDGSSE